jgi:hypothetical protein
VSGFNPLKKAPRARLETRTRQDRESCAMLFHRAFAAHDVRNGPLSLLDSVPLIVRRLLRIPSHSTVFRQTKLIGHCMCLRSVRLPGLHAVLKRQVGVVDAVSVVRSLGRRLRARCSTTLGRCLPSRLQDRRPQLVRMPETFAKLSDP